MAHQKLLVRVLSEFARTLAGEFAVSDVLHDLAERVTEVLGVPGAGVSLADSGRIRFVAAIDEVTAAIERVQEDTQEGPCVDAHRAGELVLVADLRDDPGRWPTFAERARELGIVAVAGIPMSWNGTRLGALDLYSTARRDWLADDVVLAQVLADMATCYIAHASELERSRRTVEQLQEALESRVVIEQAKGMLAAERSISVNEAFELIRSHARSHSASLRAVGEAIVNLGLRF
jgi:GAF domain-containing protein